MHNEAATRADFRQLRYAQCWEDADILLDALAIEPGDTCLAIASAGDNALSMLSRGPARVIAVDMNPAQLAALELRVAAYRELDHPALLELMGSRPSARRGMLYARCRRQLSPGARRFWDANAPAVARGIGGAGKFERYFKHFRTWVLPLVHDRRRVATVLASRPREERARFYDDEWDTRVWRLLFRIFFSETVLGRLGRDPSFFRYANESVADHLLARVRHALAEQDPSINPYLAWIVTGAHDDALPHALRPENFDAIRANIDRLVLRCATLESLTADALGAPIARANLSDVFEYLSVENSRALLTRMADLARPGARFAYWNMMVPRRGADYVPDRLRGLPDLSARLFAADKAFFYRDFVVEEVVC